MKIHSLIFFPIILIMFSIPGYAENRYRYVNFGGSADFPVKGWVNTGKYDDLKKWGKTNSYTLMGDREPLADGVASFVSKFGAAIDVSGLNQHVRYILWLDPVRFKPDKKMRINSRLEVYADQTKIYELKWGEMNYDQYIPVDIPDELTFGGSVTISFREYSDVPGLWGFWDLIIAEEGYFPDMVDVESSKKPKELNELKSNIQNKKNSLKKDQKSSKPEEPKAKEKTPDKPAEPVDEKNVDLIKKAVNEMINKKSSDGKPKTKLQGDVVEPVSPTDPVIPDVVE